MGEGGIDSPDACAVRRHLSGGGLCEVVVGLLQTQLDLPRVQHQAAGIVARLAYDDDEVDFMLARASGRTTIKLAGFLSQAS